MVSTLAGSSTGGNGDGIGTAATFNWPYGITADSAGFVYVTDQVNNNVRKIAVATGTVTTLAGGFNQPGGVAWDGVQTLYLADTYNHCIRTVNTGTGAVTTLAGSCGTTSFTDGPASAAKFNKPYGLALSSDGSVLYIRVAKDDELSG